MFDLELIKPYITKDEPFGPIDAFDISSQDSKVLSYLFEKQNNIYRGLHNRPSIIMGRRGSGKTAYLRTVYFEKEYACHVEIMTSSALEHISKVVENMAKEAVFTETLQELWEKTLWTCVIAEMYNKSMLSDERSGTVGNFLDILGIQFGDNSDTVLWRVSSLIEEALDTNPKDGVSVVLKDFDRKRFPEAREAVVKTLAADKKKFVILMDSLEKFQLHIDSIGRAIEGLLKFVGSMNKPRDVVDIRFCIPTELYPKVIEFSSNVNKDFKRALKLEWTASELILIGAQRLMYFISLYYPDMINGKSPFDELRRDEALAFLKAFLPEKITNQSGIQEEPLPYILRHTQLLPRHLIMFLNSIFKKSGVTQTLNPFPVNERRIIAGVRQVEELIVSEIFSAFNMLHPTAEATCERCIPQLKHTFSMGELQETYTQHGKSVFGGNSFFEFQQMLTEIGAVGVVLPGSESNKYVKGHFAYTVGHQLSISYQDTLCLHPLFSGIYRGPDRGGRPVYPYGSDLSDGDYRNRDD